MRAILAALMLCLSTTYAAAETGIGSRYSIWDVSQNGTVTASGIPLNDTIPTAAHKTLPLGSLVEVTNLDNGRQILLRILDRGPYKKGRIIDLSMSAAELLDCSLCKVRVVLVQ